MTLSNTSPALDRAASRVPDGGAPPPGGRRRLRWDALPLRRPRLVAVLGLVLLVAAVLLAVAPSSLKAGGFDDPSSDSVAAATALEELFPASQPNLVVLVTDPAAGAGSPAALAAGQAVLAGLERPGVHLVASWYSTPVPELLAKDASAGLTLVRVDGDEDGVARTADELYQALGRADAAVPVTFGGIAHINNETSTQVDSDLVLAESIALPLTLLLLVLVFRGVVAALLPTSIGVISIVGSLGVLNALSQVTSVSIFAVQLVTTLGLGLAIDYSLIVVARYREERASGATDLVALRTTMRTAGRTVLFSAAAVSGALATLLVFPLYFLRSSAYAGLAVVVITLFGALVLLPALLLLLGDRLDRWSLPGRRATTAPVTPEQAAGRFWGRLAGAAMRRPLLYSVPVVGLLVVLAVPVGHAQLGVPDERMLPTTSEGRIVTETLATQFDVTSDQAVNVVAPVWGDVAALPSYAQALSLVDGVTAVNSAGGRYVDGVLSAAPTAADAAYSSGPATRLQLTTDVIGYSSAGRQLAEDVRATAVPGGEQVFVGGEPAQIADILGAVEQRLPLALGLIAGLTLVLLFLFTGSVLLPLKALLFNVLGLASIFGAAVWVFQDGHLSGVLGITPAPIAIAIPVLLFCVAFGLSMDYEMFLLARIKERYDATGDVVSSVREGLGASGPIITMAAAVLAVSFFAMATSVVTPIKLFGLGTGLAILLDAVVLRGVLVPSFLRLVGRGAWWAPRPLRALHKRFGLSD